ncbi:HlyD family secretion protein [Aurantivibrio infirmus]
MLVCKRKIIGLIAAISVYSTTAFCATVGQEKEALAALNNTLKKQNADLLAAQSKVNVLPPEAVAAQAELEQAKKDFIAAEKELNRLKQLQASNPSADVDRDLMLQENTTRFAGRAKDREQRELDRIMSKHANSGEDIAALQAKIEATKRQIERQEQRVTDAQIEARAQEIAALAPKPVAPAPIAVAPVPAPAPAPVQTVEEPKPAAPTKPAAQISLSDYDKSEINRVRESIKSFNARIATPPENDEPSISDLQFRGTGVERSVFEYLGSDIYRTESTIEAGLRKLRAGRQEYAMEIPKADDGEIYVFYYDAEDRRNPTFVAVKKSLLDHL